MGLRDCESFSVFGAGWSAVAGEGAGDFNELMHSSEKMGGINRSQSQMQLFWDVIDECNFMDLGFVGS